MSNKTQIIGKISGVKKIIAQITSEGRDKYFVYEKVLPSEQWVIKHSLNKHPSVTIVDSAENIVYGNIEYVSDNEIIITFSAGFSGKAYLN
jgi:hypothetical protein